MIQKAFKMKLRSYFFVSACIIRVISVAQSFNIHLDKSFYTVGESIQYQIYPSPKIAVDSMLIYIELYSGSGKMEEQILKAMNMKG